MSVCAHRGLKEGAGPGADVIGSYELQDMGSENVTQVI